MRVNLNLEEEIRMELNNSLILKKMNFSDFKVLKTEISKNEKKVFFALSGAWLMKNGKRVELGEGYIELSGYSKIIIIAYDAKQKKEKTLTEEDCEGLREICELDVDSKKIVIKGFGKETSNWIEFHIDGGIFHGEFFEKIF